MVTKHPDTTFLMDYTTGSLSTAPLIAITAHLQVCEKCREQVDSLSHVGGEMLASTDALPVSDDLFDQVLSCIDQGQPAVSKPSKKVDDVARSLPDYVQQFLPDGELRWRFLSPSLRVSPITCGESTFELALHRIKAGGRAPNHDHKGLELTVVLKGSFSDEDGVYQEGDFIVREPGDVHRPHAAQNHECICLSVCEAPIKLTGVKGVLNPFLSFAPS